MNNSTPIRQLMSRLYLFGLIVLLLYCVWMLVDAFKLVQPVRPPLEVASHDAGCTDQLSLRLATMIRTYPSDFASNGYVLTNNKIAIWIANDDYGIAVGKGKTTSPATGYEPSDECKAILHREIQFWKGNSIRDALSN